VYASLRAYDLAMADLELLLEVQNEASSSAVHRPSDQEIQERLEKVTYLKKQGIPPDYYLIL
jgi:hypothetical protein